jgi:hypothetical protein
MSRSLFLLPLLLLAGCGSDPAYPPPTADEAKAAYARAIRADLIDSPPQRTFAGPAAIVPGDTPRSALAKTGGVLNQEAELGDRAIAPGRLASLDKVTVGECAWGSIDPATVRPYGRGRVEGQVGEGFSCDFEVFHDTDTRGLVSARGTGFFFHREGSYDFAGSKMHTSFQPASGR